MFVRFRNSRKRLQLSLVSTSRADGKVRHEHVASLGSIPAPASLYDRLDFWQQFHGRLIRLNNRLDAKSLQKVMASVHERVPMVTQAEQRVLKLQSAEEDARFAQSLHDLHQETVDGHKGIAVRAQSAIAEGEVQMAKLARDATKANEIAEKLRSGEDVPGKISRPMTGKEFLAGIGWTQADLRHARVLQELDRLGLTEQAIQAKLDNRIERAIYRKVLRDRTGSS